MQEQVHRSRPLGEPSVGSQAAATIIMARFPRSCGTSQARWWFGQPRANAINRSAIRSSGTISSAAPSL